MTLLLGTGMLPFGSSLEWAIASISLRCCVPDLGLVNIFCEIHLIYLKVPHKETK